MGGRRGGFKCQRSEVKSQISRRYGNGKKGGEYMGESEKGVNSYKASINEECLGEAGDNVSKE